MNQNSLSQSSKITKELKSSKICYFDLDDFSESNNRLDWLWSLKKEFPNFKVNLFAPLMLSSEEFFEYINRLSWIQLCVHGANHVNNEEVPFSRLEYLSSVYGFSKVYRAPFWQLSDSMYKTLTTLNYKIMIHPDDTREGVKYNWNIKDTPPALEILYGHGHVQDVCENGLVESFGNIMKLPKDTEFRFL